MTPRRTQVKIKRLENQLKRFKDNPKQCKNINLRIQTLKNTAIKR